MSEANKGSCPSARWQATDCFCRPGAKQAKCHICRKTFVMDAGGWRKTKVLVREHRVSWFRGDDVVEFAHTSCVANVRYVAPGIDAFDLCDACRSGQNIPHELSVPTDNLGAVVGQSEETP